MDGRHGDGGFIDDGGDAVVGEGGIVSGWLDRGTAGGTSRIRRGKSG